MDNIFLRRIETTPTVSLEGQTIPQMKEITCSWSNCQTPEVRAIYPGNQIASF
jgi:hypothetical protein